MAPPWSLSLRSGGLAPPLGVPSAAFPAAAGRGVALAGADPLAPRGMLWLSYRLRRSGGVEASLLLALPHGMGGGAARDWLLAECAFSMLSSRWDSRPARLGGFLEARLRGLDAAGLAALAAEAREVILGLRVAGSQDILLSLDTWDRLLDLVAAILRLAHSPRGRGTVRASDVAGLLGVRGGSLYRLLALAERLGAITRRRLGSSKPIEVVANSEVSIAAAWRARPSHALALVGGILAGLASRGVCS